MLFHNRGLAHKTKFIALFRGGLSHKKEMSFARYVAASSLCFREDGDMLMYSTTIYVQTQTGNEFSYLLRKQSQYAMKKSKDISEASVLADRPAFQK